METSDIRKIVKVKNLGVANFEELYSTPEVKENFSAYATSELSRAKKISESISELLGAYVAVDDNDNPIIEYGSPVVYKHYKLKGDGMKVLKKVEAGSSLTSGPMNIVFVKHFSNEIVFTNYWAEKTPIGRGAIIKNDYTAY